MTRARYLIVPGYVTSEHDGQRHYVGAGDLVALYKVALADCIIAPEPRIDTIRERDLLTNRVETGELIALRPRGDGNYRLPAPAGKGQA